MANAGDMKNFPANEDDGVKVFEDSGKASFVDTGVKLATRYYYSAFAFGSAGWSAIDWDATLSVEAGATNPNMARDKKVVSNIDFQSDYSPYKAVDGNRESLVGTTQNAKVDEMVYANIDLKEIKTVRQIRVYQGNDRHRMTKEAKVKYSNDGVTWTTAAKKPMALHHIGGIGAEFDMVAELGEAKSMRYVRIEASMKASYYWGLGEVEIYEQAATVRHLRP